MLSEVEPATNSASAIDAHKKDAVNFFNCSIAQAIFYTLATHTFTLRVRFETPAGTFKRHFTRCLAVSSGANLTLGSRALALKPAKNRHCRRTQAYDFHH